MFMDKVAIITGANRGIGFAIAKKLHEGGASVALCGRSTTRDFSQDRAMAVMMDIRDQNSVDTGIHRILDRFAKIDILVNYAGISGVTPLSTVGLKNKPLAFAPVSTFAPCAMLSVTMRIARSVWR